MTGSQGQVIRIIQAEMMSSGLFLLLKLLVTEAKGPLYVPREPLRTKRAQNK